MSSTIASHIGGSGSGSLLAAVFDKEAHAQAGTTIEHSRNNRMLPIYGYVPVSYACDGNCSRVRRQLQPGRAWSAALWCRSRLERRAQPRWTRRCGRPRRRVQVAARKLHCHCQGLGLLASRGAGPPRINPVKIGEVDVGKTH